MAIIKKLWGVFSRLAYRVVSAVLSLFKITIDEAAWQKLMQFVKFCLVGVSNTVIDYVTYLIALYIFGALSLFGDKAYIPASVLGMLVSVTNAFYWNYKYVFKTEGGGAKSVLWMYCKTVLSYSVTGLGVKTALLYLFITVWGMSEIVAPVIIMFITVPLNFLMNKLWAFRGR